MDELAPIVGVVSGLISIYSFITGATTLRQLRRQPRPEGEGTEGMPASFGGTSGQKPILWVSGLVFVISLVVTLCMGLAGSDVGGMMFLLLFIAAGALFVYLRWRQPLVRPPVFLIASVIVLGLLGLSFGAISSGEEGIGLLMGLCTGGGIGIMSFLLAPESAPVVRARSAAGPVLLSPAKPEPTGADAEREKEVLRLAKERGGDVRVTDVALDTSLSLDRAQAMLESLAERGHCEKQTPEGGSAVYRFPDFHGAQES